MKTKKGYKRDKTSSAIGRWLKRYFRERTCRRKIKDIRIRFKDQPKHYDLYRIFHTICTDTGRTQSATLRMLMQRFVDEEER